MPLGRFRAQSGLAKVPTSLAPRAQSGPKLTLLFVPAPLGRGMPCCASRGYNSAQASAGPERVAHGAPHDRNRYQAEAPNYGIDAPGAVRNLILGGAAALVLAVLSYLLDWALTRMATGIAIGWLFIAGWMIWDSKVGKLWSATACSTASSCGATRRC